MEAQFLRIRGRHRIYPVSRMNPEKQEVIVETELGELPFPVSSVEFISMEELKPVAKTSDDSEHAVAQVDLHGLRVEEALTELERAIENALAAGSPKLRVIHGKGTGALRLAVWEHLRHDQRVDRFSLDYMSFDSTGATLVEFL